MRFYLAAIFALFAQLAIADHQWQRQSDSTCKTSTPSATAQCIQQTVRTTQTFTNITYLTCNATTQYCTATANYQQVVGGTTYTYTDGLNTTGTCGAGTTFNAATGLCFQTCTVAGQVNSQTDGSCSCPSGQQPDTGTFSDILNGYQKQCATPANICSRRKGQGYVTFSPDVASDGCSVVCTISSTLASGAPIPNYQCTYTGATAGGANGTDSNTSAPQTEVTAPNVPNLPPPSFTHDPNPDGSCNAGEVGGQINGQQKCVPSTKTDGTPNTATSPTNTQTETQVTNTSTQTNSDGSTTTTTTTTTTVTGTTSGSSTSNGSSNSANECDPTSANYAACIKMSDAVKAGIDGSSVGAGSGNGNGGQQTYGNADYSQWFNTSQLDQQIEQGKQDLKDQFDQARQSISDGMSLAGNANLPSFGPVEVLGKSISFDLNKYQSELSVIAQALIFVSLLISAYIVLHR